MNGEKEVFERTNINGDEYLRLMQPLMVNTGCLLCHGGQGFEVGKPGGGIGIALPMKQLREQEAAAIVSKIAILDTALNAIITIDQKDLILEFNPAAEKIFGYAREEVIGKKMAELIVPESLRQQHYEGLQRHLLTSETTIIGTRIETTAMRSDGAEFPIELTITRIDQEDAPLFTAYLRDITINRQMAQQLLHQASHDYLTSLLNRHSFEQSLQRLLDNRLLVKQCGNSVK